MSDTVDTSSSNLFTNSCIHPPSSDYVENGNDLEKGILDNRNFIPRNLSEQGFFEESKPEGRVLVLYTGGTIGMVRNKNGGTCFNFSFSFKTYTRLITFFLTSVV